MKGILPLLLLAACAGAAWFLMAEEDDSKSGTETPVVSSTETGLEEPAQPSETTIEAGTLDRQEVASDITAENVALEGTEDPEVDPLQEITIRVVSPEGIPKPGVPVVLLYEALWGPQELDRQRTGEDGTVTLKEQPIWNPNEEVLQMAVGFPFHCAKASEPVKFGTDAWPAEVVELELPETGSFEVHLLDQDGNLWPHPAELKMSPASMFGKKGKGFRDKTMANLAYMVKGGIAVYPHVELGRRFDIGIPWDPWATWETVRITGPKEVGEMVKVELRVQEVRPQWTVRLLHEDGMPLSSREVLVQRKSWERSVGSQYTRMNFLGNYETDADGRLMFPLSADPTAAREELQFTVGPSGHPRFAYGTREILQSQAGQDQDLGDLLLQAPTLLAAGNVRNAAGVPLEASVSAAQAYYNPFDPEAEPEFDWTPGSELHRGEDGAFRITGIPKSQTVRLSASANGYAEKVVSVDRGCEGVEIVLATDLGIPGRLQVPAGIHHNDLIVRFFADGETRQFQKYNNSRYPDAGPKEDGSFRIAEIPDRIPGAVAVQHRHTGILLALVESVVPTILGETGDPRLDPIDLGQLQAYRVEVESPFGGKVRGLRWAIADDGALLPEDGEYDFGNDFDFLWIKTQATVHVLADGFLITTANLTPGDNFVELRSAPLVQFEAPDLPALPEGLRYSIQLDSLDGPDLLDLHTNLPTGAQGGVFPVPMPGTGRFQVQLSVWNRETGKSADVLVDGEPWLFDFRVGDQAAGQKIEVPIPVEGIEQAVEIAQEEEVE